MNLDSDFENEEEGRGSETLMSERGKAEGDSQVLVLGNQVIWESCQLRVACWQKEVGVFSLQY